MEDICKILKILSNKDALRICISLLEKEMTNWDISIKTGISKSIVDYHLFKLGKTSILKRRVEREKIQKNAATTQESGYKVYFSINPRFRDFLLSISDLVETDN
ncbi:MAG: ArsR family transcriptional regulator [Candidatus Hydrothermarchaeota archaeon]